MLGLPENQDAAGTAIQVQKVFVQRPAVRTFLCNHGLYKSIVERNSFFHHRPIISRDLRLFFQYNVLVGYSRRREDREIADYIRKSDERIVGLTLGQLCAAGMVKLDVACHCCPRRGRYTITRLIDRHGPNILLSDLKSILSADCSKHGHTGVFNRCGVQFPGVG